MQAKKRVSVSVIRETYLIKKAPPPADVSLKTIRDLKIKKIKCRILKIKKIKKPQNEGFH